jgi:hypothetical protein
MLDKNLSTIVLGSLVAVSFLVTPANCDKCCLSEMMNMDNMKSIFVTSGYTNVKAISNTCDEFSLSGDMSGFTSTQTWKALDNNAVEFITTMSASGTVIPVGDVVTPDFCNTATKNGARNIPAANPHLFTSSIFHGQLNIVFNNPSHSAHIKIFNAQGIIVAERNNISECQYAWKPIGLSQGFYVIRVVTRENTQAQKVIFSN